MTGLFYILRVTKHTPGNVLYEAIYRRRSAHSFVSPLGTELFFAAQDYGSKEGVQLEDFHMRVGQLEDMQPTQYARPPMAVGDFNMWLRPLQDEESDEYETPHPLVLGRYLVTNGWEKIWEYPD